MNTTSDPEPEDKSASIVPIGCFASFAAAGLCGILFVMATIGEIGRSHNVAGPGDPDRMIRNGLIATPTVLVIGMVITFLLAWKRSRKSGKN